ncbi:MAG TPA: RNA polymerase sigma factor [Gemmatimonadales bacterium]|nr:RNA polymerase sigma factor [Gemmatimonadales bacterium]
MSETDLELARRARRGDLTAFGTLISRHRLGLERYALHLLGQREDAEEALQDTLVRAWRSIGQCAHPDRFKAWLVRILVNRCRTALVRRGPQVRRMADEEALTRVSVDHPAQGDGWPDEIHRALETLSIDAREAFLLKHVEGFSYEEMVALTGASVPALKMRVSRACEQLRVQLENGAYD